MTETPAPRWTPPPPAIGLDEHTLDVWCIPHTQPTTVYRRLEEALSRGERERAERFRVEHALTAYVVTRGLLRHLLAHYLRSAGREISIDELCLETGEYDKPFLSAEQNWSEASRRLYFNVSHSGRLSLLAFVRGMEVGVDVEHLKRRFDRVANIAGYFAPHERRALGDVEEEQHRAAFFRCWTRKEAFLKATGRGFSSELDSFAVSLVADAPRLVWLEEGEPSNWTLIDLDPAPHYTGAACLHTPEPPKLRTFGLEGEALERLVGN